MSNSSDNNKLSARSGGGYKPVDDVGALLPEVKPETIRERALRQKRERLAELTYTPEDSSRWDSQRERVIATNGTSELYTSLENAAMYVGGVTKSLGDTITSSVEIMVDDPLLVLESMNEAAKGVARGVVDSINYFPDVLINAVAPEYSVGAQARVNEKINSVINGVTDDYTQHKELLNSGDYEGAGSIVGGYAATIALPGKKVGFPQGKGQFLQGAGHVAKPGDLNFMGPLPQEIDTVFRVQGGSPPKASWRHIEIDSNGNPLINKTTLNVSLGDPEHAKYFQSLRPGSEITSFDIPKWMGDFIENEAVPQINYKSNPKNQGGLAPKVVDPTTPGRSYELPSVWAEWLEETAIPGSGKVIK
ncbi:hypothetical protein [Vibrio campbellii]|uniref:hypothetical protein n=1 Tax=Vibrio campbellii TaxID=680 RepID=UPI0002ADD76A|nr:hypothetical protein [Vibrio campbellii]ARV75627.1 transposase [Vibrio campbellii CAIM 519 = NBRC 15631 = ATCC 25920]ELU50236.1 transposase [Vibrio campbellii CAIM 519 = NBRC 15631 = ATCC 25920]HDM8045870.1 transposase [Vibrio campbellii]